MSDQNVRIKGFGKVIICAQFQSDDLIDLPPPGGQEDHWHTNLVMEIAQGLQSIHAGEHNIQQDDIRALLDGHCDGILG